MELFTDYNTTKTKYYCYLKTLKDRELRSGWYIDQVMNGLHYKRKLGYDNNIVTETITAYKDGNRHGPLKTKNAEGLLLTKLEYKNDVLNGEQLYYEICNNKHVLKKKNIF